MNDLIALAQQALHSLPIALPALLLGYLIFGLTGFGTALIAAPLLAQAMPLATIVPLLALMDCVAAVSTGVRFNKIVSRQELYWLVPLMMGGTAIGATLLFHVPAQPMMLALGIFVFAYALYSLFAPPPTTHIKRGWVLPFGVIGGVFSAMFGSGGPIYALYLSRRLHDRDTFRATTASLLGFATITRAIIFAFAGFYSDGHTIMLALMLLPAMAAGLWIAGRIAGRLSREHFLRVLHVLLIGSGLSLIIRAAFSQ